MAPNLFFQKFKFNHPCSISIVGSSSSGKTTLLFKLVKHVEELFKDAPKKLVLVYSQYQSVYDTLYNNTYFRDIEIISNLDFSTKNLENSIVIIDDCMTELMKSKHLQEVFTKLSHHKSITIVTLTQNLYPSGRFSKDIRLNLHYYILMKSFSMQSQVKCLGNQLFPNHPRFLIDAYKKATFSPFSYLVVVLHPQWDDDYRVLSKIFPSEDVSVFIPE